MQALVLTVKETIATGKTSVSFGPPAKLGLDTMEELFRANLGRLPSINIEARTTGVSNNNASIVKGSTNSGSSSAMLPPSGAPSDPNPYFPSDASAGAAPKVALSPGTHNGTTMTGSPLTVAAGTGTIYAQVDFTYDAYNTVTVVDNMMKSTTGAVPASTVTPGGSGGGSGTLYQPIASYTATVTAGKASVVASRLVGGSQQFGVCGGAISGPWGV